MHLSGFYISVSFHLKIKTMISNNFSLFIPKSFLVALSILSINSNPVDYVADCADPLNRVVNTELNQEGLTNIFFVRHAEKSEDGTSDPELTEEGKKRSRELATLLKDKDIDIVYSTPYKRTMQTGLPTAEIIGREVVTYDPRDPKFIDNLLLNHKGENILVVGHSNTVPMMVNYILGKNTVNVLGENDYGNLFKLKISDKDKVLETENY